MYSIALFTLLGCGAHKYRKVERTIKKAGLAALNNSHFVGFVLYDPTTQDTLYQHNSGQYFTPASTTKIFTLYTAMKLLPDTIPAARYTTKGDTICIAGTGDPSFLHPYFKDSTALQLAQQYANVSLSLANYTDDAFGPGWAWEDYQWYFSPERSGMPMYGNVAQLFYTDSLHVTPSYFNEEVVLKKGASNRAPYYNTFYFDQERKDTLTIPFKTNDSLTKKLWEQLLHKQVTITNALPNSSWKTVHSILADSIYTRMMHQSDNFLAEQLMVMATASMTPDSLSFSTAKDYSLTHQLAALEQQPRWVDGSGLSRYNLFSPASLVHVLNTLYTEIPKERLFHLFPAGGVSGTLKEWYPGHLDPYIYAKSGTIGNTYCLAGYLITKSGSVLIFSFMNNHFRQPVSEIKMQMQTIFEMIRDTY